LIELRNVSKHYGDTPALEDISAKLQNGRIYAVLGHPGAGKSTLLRLLAGVLDADGGTVKINGFDMRRESVAAKRCIGYLPDEEFGYEDMTVTEYLVFVASARGLSYERAVRRAHDAVELGGLEQDRNRLLSAISASARCRLGIVQSILGKQDILLLDEPFADPNPRRVAEERELLRTIAQNKTVFFTTSDVSEAKKLADHVLLLAEGKLILSLPMEEAGDTLGEQFRSYKPTAAAKAAGRRRSAPERDGEYELIDEDGGDRA